MEGTACWHKCSAFVPRSLSKHIHALAIRKHAPPHHCEYQCSNDGSIAHNFVEYVSSSDSRLESATAFPLRAAAAVCCRSDRPHTSGRGAKHSGNRCADRPAWSARCADPIASTSGGRTSRAQIEACNVELSRGARLSTRSTDESRALSDQLTRSDAMRKKRLYGTPAERERQFDAVVVSFQFEKRTRLTSLAQLRNSMHALGVGGKYRLRSLRRRVDVTRQESQHVMAAYCEATPGKSEAEMAVWKTKGAQLVDIVYDVLGDTAFARDALLAADDVEFQRTVRAQYSPMSCSLKAPGSLAQAAPLSCAPLTARPPLEGRGCASSPPLRC